MSKVKLKTCTKKQIFSSINYMFNNAKKGVYILLEDQYCEDPELFYASRGNDRYFHNAYGEIIIDSIEDGKYYRTLIDHTTEEPSYGTVQGLTDYIWDIVQEYYQ